MPGWFRKFGFRKSNDGEILKKEEWGLLVSVILFSFFLLTECAAPFLSSVPSGAMMRLELSPFRVTLQDFEDFDG